MSTDLPARARAGLLPVATAMAVAVALAGCGSHATAAKHQRAGSTPTASPTVTNVQLANAVLGAADAPPGTTYLKKQSGRQSLADVLHSGKDAAANQAKLRASGFRDAYRSLFLGTPSTADLGANQRTLGSYALVFPDAAAARKVAKLLAASTRSSGTSVHALADPRLGEESIALQSPLPSLGGSTFYYSWVQGSAVRVLLDGGGPQGTDARSSLALARRLAATPGSAPGSDTPAGSLVLQRAEAPARTSYDGAKSGPRTAADFGGLSRTLIRLKMRSAYAALFRTSGLTQQKSNGSSPTNVVSSQAQRYTSVTNASRAYHVFVDRQKKLFQGHREATDVDSNGLGSEGYGFRYVDKKAGGDIVGIGYFWRVGNLVLSLSVVGSPKFATETQARALAEKVDSRLH